MKNRILAVFFVIFSESNAMLAEVALLAMRAKPMAPLVLIQRNISTTIAQKKDSDKEEIVTQKIKISEFKETKLTYQSVYDQMRNSYDWIETAALLFNTAKTIEETGVIKKVLTEIVESFSSKAARSLCSKGHMKIISYLARRSLSEKDRKEYADRYFEEYKLSRYKYLSPLYNPYPMNDDYADLCLEYEKKNQRKVLTLPFDPYDVIGFFSEEHMIEILEDYKAADSLNVNDYDAAKFRMVLHYLSPHNKQKYIRVYTENLGVFSKLRLRVFFAC